MPDSSRIIILGCGYTGLRVARRLHHLGFSVLGTTRDARHLEPIAKTGAEAYRLEVLEPGTLQGLREKVPDGARVLHSIPTVEAENGPADPTPALIEALGARPSRMVYLSTTGVYGNTFRVDAATQAAPVAPGDQLRLEAERRVLAGPWPALVLRPAAIYGPGRGVHESIRQGRFRLVENGDNYVSRIHVEDLAELCSAALLSTLSGVYPVADAEPCTSREIGEFCAGLLRMPLPPSVARTEVHYTRRSNRRVDGSEIFRLLGVRLQFSSYRVGIPAAIQRQPA